MFGLAYTAHDAADERDYRERRHAESVNNLRISFGNAFGDRHIQTVEPKTTDRTSVWVCVIAGIVMLATSFLCVTHAGNAASNANLSSAPIKEVLELPDESVEEWSWKWSVSNIALLASVAVLVLVWAIITVAQASR